jgi:hypothetical protein
MARMRTCVRCRRRRREEEEAHLLLLRRRRNFMRGRRRLLPNMNINTHTTHYTKTHTHDEYEHTHYTHALHTHTHKTSVRDLTYHEYSLSLFPPPQTTPFSPSLPPSLPPSLACPPSVSFSDINFKLPIQPPSLSTPPAAPYPDSRTRIAPHDCGFFFFLGCCCRGA